MSVMKLHDCWNRIGVWGDGSCRGLEKAIHCRNCPVYSGAAAVLLDRELDAEYLGRWAEHYRRPLEETTRDTESAVIFRIGVEWLALPAEVFQEVCDLRPIHSLPHRRNDHVLGVTNVRGTLLVCVSLHALLGIDRATVVTDSRRLVHERLLVVDRDGERLVFPVDEIHGIHRYHPAQLGDVPATVARSTATYARAMLPWQNKAVGVLDDQLLFYSLNKSLA